jgi:hypothetical protein
MRSKKVRPGMAYWQEHQNFCNPFFDHFLRQHSSVPILIGFFQMKQELA